MSSKDFLHNFHVHIQGGPRHIAHGKVRLSFDEATYQFELKSIIIIRFDSSALKGIIALVVGFDYGSRAHGLPMGCQFGQKNFRSTIALSATILLKKELHELGFTNPVR
jgi:hypothetical protein